jgi:probable F420-dependent oxidoreductase
MALVTTVVDAARQALGPVGVCLPVSFTGSPHADLQREAVGRLEHAGCAAVWTNEVIGKDALVQAAMLLGVTEQMAFGTCVANIWARPAQTMHAAAAQLAQAYPGRFVLGLGVGYPEQAASTGREFGSPLSTMRDYLERMDSATWPPAPNAPYPRIIAANGPKMLALAGEIAHGALPAMMPAEFTAQARRSLGPDKLLVVGVSVAIGADSTAIATEVREHLTAGADHVTLLLPIGTDFAAGIAQLEQLVPALVEPGNTAPA